MHRNFTDRAVQSIEPPAAGRIEVFDEDGKLPGFGLRVTASGRKTWMLLYRHAGRPRRLTLGTYPALRVADARTKAKEALATIVQGADPAGEKRTEKEAPTFRELVAIYLEQHAKVKKRSWREDERMLKKYVPAAWSGMKAASITRRDVRELLAGLAKRTPIMANRVLACLRKLFNFGVKWELVEVNPCALLDRPAPEKRRDRVLTADELRRVWNALEAEDAATAALFKLYLLTAQRGYELRTIAFSDLDLDAGWWTVPAERAKNKLAHRIPLSPHAVSILRNLEQRRVDGSPWVFSSVSATGYRETVQKAMRRLRKASGVDFWPHDLRRTVATFLTGELRVPRLVVSKLLNHVSAERNDITAVYDRASYDGDKRAALNAWAAKLEQIVTGETGRGKVLAFRS